MGIQAGRGGSYRARAQAGPRWWDRAARGGPGLSAEGSGAHLRRAQGERFRLAAAHVREARDDEDVSDTLGKSRALFQCAGGLVTTPCPTTRNHREPLEYAGAIRGIPAHTHHGRQGPLLLSFRAQAGAVPSQEGIPTPGADAPGDGRSPRHRRRRLGLDRNPRERYSRERASPTA